MAPDGEPTGPVPDNANENCPGTGAEAAGRAAACEGCPNQAACASAPAGPDPDLVAIEARLRSVKHKILVLSGKGGVGKSTLAAQLAFALAARDREVGLLDIDICGPSAAKLAGLEGQEVHRSAAGWSPVYAQDRLGVMSIAFMLPHPDDAVIWRGPRKNGLIKQFLKDVHWGELDFLVVDAPPGTSDEHISIAQYLKATAIDGAVVVTTPQEVAIIDVRKEVTFCKKVGIPVLGVVENMAGLALPAASLRFFATAPDGMRTDISPAAHAALAAAAPPGAEISAEAAVFAPSRGGAARMAADMGVPFLGRVPLDPGLAAASEEGRAADANGPAATALGAVVAQLLAALEPASVQNSGPRPAAEEAVPKGSGALGRSVADAEVEQYLNGSGNLVSV